MPMERREFLQLLTAAGSLAATVRAERSSAADIADKPAHDMSGMPASWMGHEQIAMLLYPQFTALDLVGPQHMFTSLMGATVYLVGKTADPVTSDTGLSIVPTITFADCPRDLDILFTPGGSHGTLAAMQDAATVDWLADRGARARLVTSVCTGSLLLGQAGLLRGKRATSHWAARDLLPHFGATAVHERVVWDEGVVTGAGVSAGLDLGLAIVAKLRDVEYAQSVQLLAEYAPQLQFHAGTPEDAPPHVRDLVGGMFGGFRDQVRQTSRLARGTG